MKIISKHNDYFDWCVGHFGFDPHIVYDRRELPLLKEPSHDTSYLIHLCGERVPLTFKKGKFYFKKDEKHLDYWENHIFYQNENRPTTVNIVTRQPVVIESWGRYKIPLLAAFGFPNYISDMEMYQKIYDFLSWLKDNPAPPNTFTDKDRIQAHGFDIKRSFRPNMKQ